MYLLFVLFPLFLCVFLGLFGRFLGRMGCILFIFFSFCVLFVVGVVIVLEVGFFGCLVLLNLFVWFEQDLFVCNWFFFFDSLSCIMGLLVVFVSFCVHIYAFDYMFNDPCFIRFFMLLLLFTFFMLFFVFSGNFIQLFFGWEGVGLVSFLLISFWYTRNLAWISGLKAIIYNKIGDLFLFFGFALVYFYLGVTSFFELICLYCCNNVFIEYIGNWNVIDIFLCCIFMGVCAKSAQLGLHHWLVDAMEGPTPVSALLHAATMVTAGIFLLVRISSLFYLNESLMIFFGMWGVVTAIIMGCIGSCQFDFKRIIAYSTCSQLGLMLSGFAFYYVSISFFHLFVHAFFKALLFLGAGLIIHWVGGEQDIRRFGLFAKFLPIVYGCFYIGIFALIGFPFFSGFYSKHFLLDVGSVWVCIDSFFVWFCILVSIVCTSFYSSRLLLYVFFLHFFGFKTGLVWVGSSVCELFSIVVLMLLGFFSVFVGFFFFDFLIGDLSGFLLNSLLFYEAEYVHFEVEYKVLGNFFQFLISIIGFLFFLFYFILFLFVFGSVDFLFNFFFYRGLFWFFCRRFYFDFFYNLVAYYMNKLFFFVFLVNLEKGFLEYVGLYGCVSVIMRIMYFFSRLHSGNLFHYIYFLFFGIVLILVFGCFY